MNLILVIRFAKVMKINDRGAIGSEKNENGIFRPPDWMNVGVTLHQKRIK